MTKEVESWLLDLARDTGNISDEKIVKGFLKHYALNGLTMDDVEQDMIFHPEYISRNSRMTAMIRLMTAIKCFAEREESRTLTEVRRIVEAVREGVPVQISYYDPEADDDPYVQRKCW